MGKSFTKFYLLISLTPALSSEIVYSQVISVAIRPFPVSSKYSEYKKKTSGVKWTWRLPATVRKTFNNSQYATWYIEKIVRYDTSGKTVFRFHVNNGNLLDSDHHDSFLKTVYVDFSETDYTSQR
jgi:hypothetical protein